MSPYFGVHCAIAGTLGLAIVMLTALVCLIINGPSHAEELDMVRKAHPGAEVSRIYRSFFLVKLPDGTLLRSIVVLRDPFTCAASVRDEALSLK